MANKLRFNPDYLVCPTCMELLTREDVEGFGHCPYCNHKFEFDAELEDFLLRPVVREWVRQTRAQDEGEQ